MQTSEELIDENPYSGEHLLKRHPDTGKDKTNDINKVGKTSSKAHALRKAPNKQSALKILPGTINTVASKRKMLKSVIEKFKECLKNKDCLKKQLSKVYSSEDHTSDIITLEHRNLICNRHRCGRRKRAVSHSFKHILDKIRKRNVMCSRNKCSSKKKRQALHRDMVYDKYGGSIPDWYTLMSDKDNADSLFENEQILQLLSKNHMYPVRIEKGTFGRGTEPNWDPSGFNAVTEDNYENILKDEWSDNSKTSAHSNDQTERIALDQQQDESADFNTGWKENVNFQGAREGLQAWKTFRKKLKHVYKIAFDDCFKSPNDCKKFHL